MIVMPSIHQELNSITSQETSVFSGLADRYLCTKLHGAKSQENVILMLWRTLYVFG
jgi:hypothetical protein